MKTTNGSRPRPHLTPEVLARLLGVNHSTVLGWIRSGALPALNITSGHVPRYRIYRPDLATFLERRGASPAHVQAVLGGR